MSGITRLTVASLFFLSVNDWLRKTDVAVPQKSTKQCTIDAMFKKKSPAVAPSTKQVDNV